jgi:hypothetical protein
MNIEENLYEAWSQYIAMSRQLKSIDRMSDDMARLLCGRLRKVPSTSILAALKRELKDFNSNTGVWKNVSDNEADTHEY